MIETPIEKRGSKAGFLIVALVLGVLSALWVGYLVNQPFSAWLTEASKPAEQIDALFKLLAGMGGVVLIYVLGYLVYFAVIFRRRASDPIDAVGEHEKESVVIEGAFWVVPTIMVVIISVLSIQIWAGLQKSPGNALTVEAIGYQFNYQFRYPGLWKAADEDLHLPVGQPVTVKVTSQDVLHGFWIPEIRLKADMVPGLINNLRFTPTVAGKYPIVCTEFCGSLHGAMSQKRYLIVEAPEKFKAYLAAQIKAAGPAPVEAAELKGKPEGGKAAPGTADKPTPDERKLLASGDAEAGKATFSAKCSGCHGVGGYDQKQVGPGLGNLFNDPKHPALVNGDNASPVAVIHILKNGYNGGAAGVMPNQTQNGISDKDIANLTAYLVSLSKISK